MTADTPMLDRELAPVPREWHIAMGGFVGALALWPVLYGWGLAHGLLSAAFLIGFVWLPGRALVAWTLRCETLLERALLAWTAGMAILGVWFALTCALDERGAWWILPLAALLALFVARRKRPESVPLAAPDRRELLLLFLVLGIALARSQPALPGEWFLGYASDDEFHAENAAELLRHWPIADPRLAGEPMRYHFLSYSISAAMGKVLGLPVRECMLGLTQHFTPLVFALGVFVLARRLGARALVAAACALALVLHVDLGELAQPITGSNWSQVTPFYVGLYHSITNSAGMCLLSGMLLVLHSLLARGARARGALTLILLLALAASATKASVLPPLAAGLGALWAWKLVRRREFDGRLAASTLAILLGALPAVLWLATDTQGYAYTMFRWLPGYGVRTSGFGARIGELFGIAHAADVPLFTAALLPLWLVFFLGLSALGLCGWLLVRRVGRARDALEVPLFLTLLFGLVPCCLLASPGHSELFFGYVSVLAAALLGALGAERVLALAGARARVFTGLACAGLALYGGATLALGFVRPTLAIAREGEVDAYRSALDWMRQQLPSDAVLLADDVRMSVGSWSERRMFYSNPRFAARQRALWKPLPTGDDDLDPEPAYAVREHAQEDFLAAPSAEGLARIRELLGSAAPLYAVRSSANIRVRHGKYAVRVPAREGLDTLATLPGTELVFENTAVAIYRLP